MDTRVKVVQVVVYLDTIPFDFSLHCCNSVTKKVGVFEREGLYAVFGKESGHDDVDCCFVFGGEDHASLRYRIMWSVISTNIMPINHENKG